MDNLQSAQTNEIDAALSKAQMEMDNAVFDKKAKVPTKDGKSYEYQYASYQSIRDAIITPLTKNGISITHQLGIYEGQRVMITKLRHSSGQWIGSMMAIPQQDKETKDGIIKESPQTLGSAITYYKRYTLAPLVAIGTEDDDDGQAAEGIRHENSIQQKSLQSKGNSITSDQVQTLRDLCKQNFERLHKICREHKITTIEDLPAKEFSFVLETLKLSKGENYAKTGS